jgi:hypothetical protein
MREKVDVVSKSQSCTPNLKGTVSHELCLNGAVACRCEKAMDMPVYWSI